MSSFLFTCFFNKNEWFIRIVYIPVFRSPPSNKNKVKYTERTWGLLDLGMVRVFTQSLNTKPVRQSVGHLLLSVLAGRLVPLASESPNTPVSTAYILGIQVVEVPLETSEHILAGL